MTLNCANCWIIVLFIRCINIRCSFTCPKCYYLSPSVTIKYIHLPLWLLLIYLISVTSNKTCQVCTLLRVSPLIADTDKLLHPQEMNLHSALQQRCKSCEVGLILLWRVCWCLQSVVILQCSEVCDVWRVCAQIVFKFKLHYFRNWCLYQNIFLSS